MTVIPYQVPSGGGWVSIEIFDVSGRLIETLVDGHQTPGIKSVAWDARDRRRQPVAAGIYFCRMTAPGYEKTMRLVLIK
jgi:hypothetical protein